MRHLPISLDLRGEAVVIAGGGEIALAKLRLLRKTEASLSVFAAEPQEALRQLADAGSVRLIERPLAACDLEGVRLVYAADADPTENARVTGLARSARVLCNWVDQLDESDFLTPALVDRDPVTVAIGTEGTAPVLAREIKAEVEAMLSPQLGALARVAARFRPRAAHLPRNAPRRRLWQAFFRTAGPQALERGGEAAAEAALVMLAATLFKKTGQDAPHPGYVYLIGAGPGDPELLTMKARRLLSAADVVIYDRLVNDQVLELARREATFVLVGKTPGGPSWNQNDINALLVAKARAGAQVVRLKSGDPGIYGRLDEEMDALDEAGIAFSIIPGITAATAAAAAAKVSLTRRGRNSALRLLTGQDTRGFAEQDWRALAQPGIAAAIYMGVAAAKFLQGRLLMHGADPMTPMSVVENASLPNQVVLSAHLGDLTICMAEAGLKGPSIIFLGLSPRDAEPKASLHDLAKPLATGGL